MKFYYENLKDAIITYSGTADANYPESNLNNLSKNSLFKDTGFTGTTYLDFDLGESRTCNSIILGNQDISGVTLSLLYSIDDVTYNTAFSGVSPRDDIIEFASYDAQYWRLQFVNDPLTNNVSIGNIYLGTYLELSHNPELGIVEDNYFKGIVNESATGYNFGTELSENIFSTSFDYQYINPTEKALFETMKNSIKPTQGKSIYPFYYEDCNGDLYFVRWVGKLSLTLQNYQAWQTNIQLVEEL